MAADAKKKEVEKTADLRGIWADDSATYLTDLRNPVMTEEWKRWQQDRERRPDSPMSLRERRQFDRVMVQKYGKSCPPPARTKWQLMAYDIMDAQEAQAEKERRQRAVVYERKYVDEDL